MFVTPFVPGPSCTVHSGRSKMIQPRRTVRQSRRGLTSAWPRNLLVVWLGFGCIAMIAFPATHGDAQWGATVPFWLIAAPLINLVWTKRAALYRGLRAIVQPPIGGIRRQARPTRYRKAPLRRAGRRTKLVQRRGTMSRRQVEQNVVAILDATHPRIGL